MTPVRLHVSVLAVGSLLVLAGCSTARWGEGPVTTGPQVAGGCPEQRAMPRAPDRYQKLENPLSMTAEAIGRGRRLYESDARPAPCATCHGVDGDGRGPAGRGLVPPPRNFRCAATMSLVADGELYWVIESGSGEYHRPARQGAQEVERPGRGAPFTEMPGYGDTLSETEIWELVAYIRSLLSPPKPGAPS